VSGTDRRRVAYLMTHHPRVSLTFIFDELLGLEAAGFEVLPISINPPDAGDSHRPGFEREIGRTRYIKSMPKRQVLAAVGRAVRRSPVAVVAVWMLALRSGGTDLKRLVWRTFHTVEALVVWDRCHREDTRHLHAHFAQLPSTLAWLAAEFGNRSHDGEWTFSITVHGPHELFDEQEAYFRIKTSAASFVVAIADFTAAQIKRVTDPKDWHKVHVVRCGLDLERFRFDPAPTLSNPAVVSMVARLSPEKGHLVLVDAMALLVERGVAVVAEIVGGGSFRPEIEARIAELHLESKITLVGEVHSDQVAERLRHADLFCLPSFFEGIPISIMEAMATGLPVVATAVGGIPELVIDRRTGFLVPAGRPDALADAIEAFVADPTLRTSMAAAARELVVAEHDAAVTIKELAALF
jgi:colanic acid/amylovoran biosynthesis glycosyltransferase